MGPLALILAACSDRSPVGPEAPSTRADIRLNASATELRRLAAERGITPMPSGPRVRGNLARLGRMLAFDKELSGNRDISIDHCSESADKLRAYGIDVVPDALLRGTLLEDNKEAIIATRDPVILTVVFDAEFTRQVTAYMHALTDARARNLDRLIPKEVPSGLAVDR